MERATPVPLHCHGSFSLLRGVGSPASLAQRASELGYPALALTDRDALYGAVRFQTACRERALKPIFGAEVTLAAEPAIGLGESHVTLLAMDLAGYGNLCRLISLARLACDKGEARLPRDLLADHAAALICLSGPSATSPLVQLIRAERWRDAVRIAAWFRDVFAGRYYLELQRHYLPDDERVIADLARLGRHLDIPLVATVDVHYPQPEDRMLQDVVTGIRTRTTLSQPSPERLPNGQFFLPSPDALARRFRCYPDALANTRAIADQCDVLLDFRDVRFPPLDLPSGRAADDELRQRCDDGARRTYGAIPARVRRQLDHELQVIAQRGLAPFFLIAADVARRFRGRCRGSAAGSLVLYCLGVVVADPLKYDMLFERFINPERDTPADIDIDFSEQERERAIAYCYATYGAERTAMVANVVRYRARLAVRDVGKVLGMPLPLLDRLARSLDHYADGGEIASGIARLARRTPGEAQPWPLLARLAGQLLDTPRHLSVHVGGMLLTGKPLVEIFGLEPARKPGVVVVGADKEDVEDVGLAKLDLLCLRSMSVVQECEALECARKVSLDLSRIDLDDPQVYAAMQRADTIGASQVESRAQQQSIVRTRPQHFADLMAQVAIIRPGPIQGGMVHPYYRRRAGEEPVRYLHPSLAPILRSTYGVILYQEQVLLCVSAITGCSAGEADVVRRALGNPSRELWTKLRTWFVERATANRVQSRIAAAVFQQIAGFAGYGFCKSHAAALARLAYETMYLRIYHPAAFTAALLNNQPMGFYPVEVLVWDAKRRGIVFRPVDVNRSDARCTLEGAPPAVRLGLAMVKGVSVDVAQRIVAERAANGPYGSLRDFGQRTGVSGKAAEGLILASAFDAFGSRQQLLWEQYGRNADRQQPDLNVPEASADLPELSAHEQTLLDHVVLGFSLDHHLVEHYRRRLAGLRAVTSDRLTRWPDGAPVRVGGLVVCRQRPETAKGFVFVTLEDERGLINVIVRPDVFQRYRTALRDHELIAVAGRLQRSHGVVNVLADRALAIDPTVPDPDGGSARPTTVARPAVHPHHFR